MQHQPTLPMTKKDTLIANPYSCIRATPGYSYKTLKFILSSSGGITMGIVYGSLSLHDNVGDNIIVAYVFFGNKKLANSTFAVTSSIINAILYELVVESTFSAGEAYFSYLKSSFTLKQGFQKSVNSLFVVASPLLISVALGFCLIPSAPMYAACLEANLPEWLSVIAYAFRALATTHGMVKFPMTLYKLAGNTKTRWKENKSLLKRIALIVELGISMPVAIILAGAYSFSQREGINVALSSLSPWYQSRDSDFKDTISGAGVLSLFSFNAVWTLIGLHEPFLAFMDFTLGGFNEFVSSEMLLFWGIVAFVAILSSAPALNMADSGTGKTSTLAEASGPPSGTLMNAASTGQNIQKLPGLVSVFAKTGLKFTATVINLFCSLLYGAALVGYYKTKSFWIKTTPETESDSLLSESDDWWKLAKEEDKQKTQEQIPLVSNRRKKPEETPPPPSKKEETTRSTNAKKGYGTYLYSELTQACGFMAGGKAKEAVEGWLGSFIPHC
jgi:hypothetical protein